MAEEKQKFKSSEDIENEFIGQINELKSSIDRVGIRQDEIKGYILEVKQSIDSINQQILALPPAAFEAKAKFYLAIQKNTELISRFYDTISNFESVRHRYQQDVGRVTKDKIYFINIEMRKIESNTEETGASISTLVKELKSLINDINAQPTVVKEVMNSIEKNPQYSME